MDRATRRLTGIAFSLVLVLAPLTGLEAQAGGFSSEEASFCEDPVDVAFQGPSCPAEHGWRVQLEDGEIVRTHGSDRFGSHGAAGGSTAGNLDAHADPPVCVDRPGAYHNRLIYAYPQDVPSRHAELEDDLRRLVAEANGFLEEEARQEGYTAELRFLCAGEQVQVDEVELSHANQFASFATVVNDLRDEGYTSAYAKYWIFYDDRQNVVPAAGTATVHGDDRDVVDNRNNRGPSYAVTWGHQVASIMLHEHAHTVGAVQPSAPHFYDNPGGWHCFDDADVMCYGNDSHRIETPDTVYCPARVSFDCGKDDYFDPSPAPGSYLDEHWNIGSELNRFIEREPCSEYAASQQVSDAIGASEPAGAGPSRDAYTCRSGQGASASQGTEGHRVAVSGTGNATGTIAVSGTGNAHGSLAASGTGHAEGSYLGASGTGLATGPVAVSGTDRAEADEFVCATELCFRGAGLALSGTGDAESCLVAVSGTGSATACDGGQQVSGCGTVSGNLGTDRGCREPDPDGAR